MLGERIDIEPWREYLEAFDRYLLDGSLIARARMRRILDRRLAEADLPVTERATGPHLRQAA